MEQLINLLNKLAEKYKMDEADVKEIQNEIFKLEAPAESQDADLEAEDFVMPEEDDGYVDGEAE